MTINYLLSTTETFKQLQSFDSLDQLNESIKVAFKNFKSILTKTSMRVLAHISTYSVKYLGVSFLSKQTIADALDVNIRTIRRSFRQLEELGLIKSFRLKRAKGDKRETSSAIVIQPLVSVLAVCPTIKQSIISKNINNTEVTVEPVQEIDNEQVIKDALLSKLPEPLRVLGYFFDASNVHKHVGTIYKAKHAIDRTIAIEKHSQAFECAIKQVVSSFKLGKVRNFDGVLYAAIKSLCKSIQLKSQLNNAFGF